MVSRLRTSQTQPSQTRSVLPTHSLQVLHPSHPTQPQPQPVWRQKNTPRSAPQLRPTALSYAPICPYSSLVPALPANFPPIQLSLFPNHRSCHRARAATAITLLEKKTWLPLIVSTAASRRELTLSRFPHPRLVIRKVNTGQAVTSILVRSRVSPVNSHSPDSESVALLAERPAIRKLRMGNRVGGV